MTSRRVSMQGIFGGKQKGIVHKGTRNVRIERDPPAFRNLWACVSVSAPSTSDATKNLQCRRPKKRNNGPHQRSSRTSTAKGLNRRISLSYLENYEEKKKEFGRCTVQENRKTAKVVYILQAAIENRNYI